MIKLMVTAINNYILFVIKKIVDFVKIYLSNEIIYSTEQVLLSNHIEKPDANKQCSVITMEDPRHSYRVVQK